MKFDLLAVYAERLSVDQLITRIDHVVVVHPLVVALNVTVAQSRHWFPLATYPVSQLHLAYKLAGAALHVVTDVVSPALDKVNTYRSSLDLEPTQTSRSTTRTASAALTGAAGAGKIAVDTKDSKKTSKSSTRSRSASKYTFDRSWFIKEYEDESYDNLLNAPVYAFKGVSKEMAEDLEDAFGIKTIGDLADSKYFAWAKEIVEEAE